MVAPNDLADLLTIARTLLDERREREPRFGAGIFADPAWDLLLTVYVREAEGRASFTEALEREAGVPRSTTRRWIRMLTDRKLFELERENDAMAPIRLTTFALEGLEAHFRMIRRGLVMVGPEAR